MKKIVFTFLVSLAINHCVFAQVIQGKVIGVSDGDTLTVLTNHQKQFKIRLTEIDAPEKSQAFGNQSKQSLSKLCFLQKAKVVYHKIDRYGRYLGRVYCNTKDANAYQIQTGMAWVYERYVTDKSLYQLQSKAQAKQLGIWRGSNPVPPWLYRKHKKRHLK